MINLFKKRYSIVIVNENGDKENYENIVSTKRNARKFCKHLEISGDQRITILDTKAKYYRTAIKYLATFAAALILAITFVSLLFIASLTQ